MVALGFLSVDLSAPYHATCPPRVASKCLPVPPSNRTVLLRAHLSRHATCHILSNRPGYHTASIAPSLPSTLTAQHLVLDPLTWRATGDTDRQSAPKLEAITAQHTAGCQHGVAMDGEPHNPSLCQGSSAMDAAPIDPVSCQAVGALPAKGQDVDPCGSKQDETAGMVKAEVTDSGEGEVGGSGEGRKAELQVQQPHSHRNKARRGPGGQVASAGAAEGLTGAAEHLGVGPREGTGTASQEPAMDKEEVEEEGQKKKQEEKRRPTHFLAIQVN